MNNNQKKAVVGFVGAVLTTIVVFSFWNRR